MVKLAKKDFHFIFIYFGYACKSSLLNACSEIPFHQSCSSADQHRLVPHVRCPRCSPQPGCRRLLLLREPYPDHTPAFNTPDFVPLYSLGQTLRADSPPALLLPNCILPAHPCFSSHPARKRAFLFKCWWAPSSFYSQAEARL